MKTMMKTLATRWALGLTWICVGGTVLSQEALYSIQGATPASGFGTDIDLVGDLDGDGISEFCVGAPFAGASGEVTLHSGADGTPVWIWVRPGTVGDQVGRAVCVIGDITGDFKDDIAVGYPMGSSGGSESGGVAVLSGADGSLLYSISGSAAGDEFGTDVCAIGDMDGDGISEFCVGIPGATGATGDDVGKVSVRSGIDGTELMVVYGDRPGDRFGQSLAKTSPTGVDLNSDGTPDFLVGAEQPLGSGYVRAVSGQGGTTLYTLSGNAIGDSFGRSLAWVDDYNGDGINCFLIGWPGNDTKHRDGGAVRVISAADGTTLYTRYGLRAGDCFGHSCAALGDYDGDGISEILVGAPGTNGAGNDDAGEVAVLSGVNGLRLLRVQGSSSGQNGTSVAPIGDIDGDGIDEFLIGAPGDNSVIAMSPLPSQPWPGGKSNNRKTLASHNPWKHKWGNAGSGWIGGWYIGADSRFVAGHFIAGHPTEQLLALGPLFGPGDYAKLMVHSAGNWPNPWGNNGNGSIGF